MIEFSVYANVLLKQLLIDKEVHKVLLLLTWWECFIISEMRSCSIFVSDVSS